MSAYFDHICVTQSILYPTRTAMELKDGRDGDAYMEQREGLFHEMVSPCCATCPILHI